MKSLSICVAAALVLGLLTACTPKPGESCKDENKEICLDAKTALVCHGGRWESMPCRGSSGCSGTGRESVCDQSVAEASDVCNLPDDHVCTADKKAMLHCKANKWTLAQSCLGDRGCVTEIKKVSCDNSVANAGDPCLEEGDYACAVDRKHALACRNGIFQKASPCKGPKACRVTGSKEQGFKVECDDTVASPGDACQNNDHFSCSADERAILKCRNNVFAIEERCRAKEKCQIRGGQVGCY